MKNIIVLMTALIPTTGHSDIIEFASRIPGSHVYVLINGRSFEPINTASRLNALKEHFADRPNISIKASNNNNAPQQPEDMPEGFWDWWKNEINTNVPEVNGNWGYVVASEPYGQQVAQSLNAEFIPYDIQRVINPTKGTEVRNDVYHNWEDIIPEFKRRIAHNVVMFGQESVGKTTLSKIIGEHFPATHVMEFARPYLEAVGEDVTLQKMNNIVLGQSSLQRTVRFNARSPINVFDTDLYTTMGYYNLWYGHVPKLCSDLARESSSDKYYVLPDDVPFESDILRYGENKRETDTKYWAGILHEHNLPYVIVPTGSLRDKVEFIVNDITHDIESKLLPISEFKR